MKKIFLTTTAIILAVTLFYSCTKNTAETTVTEQQAADQLLQSENFGDFAKNFVPDLVNLVQSHRQANLQNRSSDFLNQVKLADNDETKLAGIYQSYSLNFDGVVLLKNKVDNDLLGLLNTNKFLSRFDEAQTQRILFNALETIRSSPDQKWQALKKEINQRMGVSSSLGVAMQSVRLNKVDVGTGQPGLTWDEVWDCVKNAVGFGSAGVLGIAALKKLATEGIQEVIITLTRFLAKRAGWFGLAIAMIDFSSCMYKESND